MITLSSHFAHSFKIMRIPQPGLADVILLHTAQVMRCGKGDEINIAYIRCIDGRDPEAFKLWALAEDGIREVHPFARVQIRDDFTAVTFYNEFFNARKIQIIFLGRRSINGSVQWLDDPRASPQAEFFCQVTTWNGNTSAHSWVPYPNVILPDVSTIQ